MKNRNDYERLKLQQSFIKHKQQTGLDCAGQSYNEYQFCHVCENEEFCKATTLANKKKAQEDKKQEKEMPFTPEQITWLTAYVNGIVADNIDHVFEVLQNEIANEVNENEST